MSFLVGDFLDIESFRNNLLANIFHVDTMFLQNS